MEILVKKSVLSSSKDSKLEINWKLSLKICKIYERNKNKNQKFSKFTTVFIWEISLTILIQFIFQI